MAPVREPADWLVDWPADWLEVDWLVVDWRVDPDRVVVAGAVAVLPVVVMTVVNAVSRSAWLRVSDCRSRWIFCCVGAVLSAPMHALMSAWDGAVVVVLGLSLIHI